MDYRMIFRPSQIFTCLLAGFALSSFSAFAGAQDVAAPGDSAISLVASADLPEAPRPQFWVAPPSSISDQETAPKEAGQSSSSSSSTEQSPSTPAPAGAQGKPVTQEKTQRELAEEQLKQQKKQRVLGVVPNFNTTYNSRAVSLTAKQKFDLAWHASTDPVQFGITGFVALLEQAEGSDYGYGGGIGGYAKRYGATYAGNFDGAMIGNALLPAVLHQDPRYFRLGYGTTKHRILYALATNVICKHDNTGKWEPNYSNVMGNLASGAISNAYIPDNERGLGGTFSGFAVVMAEGGVGSIFQEFWPDIARHFLHRDPTNGQDAINRKLHNDQ
jgi:hypothetical protein